jgi:peptidoglycan/LPS O-acetylase OafA/YrhL
MRKADHRRNHHTIGIGVGESRFKMEIPDNLGSVRYIPAFDGLRAICIFFVIAFHVISSDRLWLQNIAHRGWCGVDIFFVLSGFLITWILITEQDKSDTINLPRFYIRRAMRLQPAYLSGLSGFSLLLFLFHRTNFNLIAHALPYFLTYSLNLGLAFGLIAYPPYGLAWSLCIEEQFYLCWPWVLRRLGTQKALPVMLFIIGLVAVHRSIVYLSWNWTHLAAPSMASLDRIYYATDTRIDTLLIGCVIALALRLRVLDTFITHFRRPWFTVFALALTVVVFAWSTGGQFKGGWRAATLGFTLMSASAGLLILALFLNADSGLSSFLSWKPMVFVGKISYGIYLFHDIIWNAYAHTFHLSDQAVGTLTQELTALAVVSILSVAVAALHYRFIEKRFLKLRDWLENIFLMRKSD